MAEDGVEISGDGVLELMQDGFGYSKITRIKLFAWT